MTPLFLFNSRRKKILSGLFTGLILLASVSVCFIPVNENKVQVFLPERLPVSRTLDSLPVSHFRIVFQGLSSLPVVGKDSFGPGYYEMESGRNILQWYKVFAGNYQTPLRITQPSFRTLPDLAVFWADKLRLSSSELLDYWYSPGFLQDGNFNPDQLPCLFLPETYELYWTTSPEGLSRKIISAWHRFWNPQRLAKAQAMGLNPMEVCILASIVQEESNIREEQSVIAGVYLNRLKSGMKLQADPTVRFASGDFGLRRILFSHLKTDSRWNTYLYPGLPPGPINIPDRQSIDRTLDAADHDYIYFCALPDFSGRHAFTRDYALHLKNAREYQKALNSLPQSSKP